jgi:hypothetical protein
MSASVPKVVIVSLLFCFSGCAGFMTAYHSSVFQFRPGRQVPVALEWPASSRIQRDPDSALLILFVHPLCSCTAATFSELSRVLRRPHGTGIAVRIVFADGPVHADPEKFPHAELIRDVGGREAERFGALTSGMVLFYDKQGRLRFQGGITASRGHAGENRGAEMLAAAIDGDRPEVSRSFVYGCSLTGTERARR